MSIISSLLQTAGVAAISLFFTILLGGTLPARLQVIIGNIGFSILGGGVLLLMLLGTCSSAFTTYYGIRLSWRQYEIIATRLLEKYLYRDYEWHLRQNSAQLSKAVISEVQTIVNLLLQQIVMLMVRGSEILLIGGLLVVSRPIIALAATLSFSLVYGVLYRWNRNFVEAQGKIVASAYTDRQRSVNEALGGIKAIKVAQLEPFFLNHFKKAAGRLSGAMANIEYFSQLPKYFIELLVFGGLVTFVVLSHERHWSTTESIPLLALYGAAAIRLLPAAQQIYTSFTFIVGSRASLRSIIEGLTDPPEVKVSHQAQETDSESLLTFLNVDYLYEGSDKSSLRCFNLTIRPGEKVGIVGPTGAGKTTLVDLLLGLLQPSEGTISRSQKNSHPTLVSYVPQQLHFVDDTIAANIALGHTATERDLQKVQHAAKQARIHEHIESLPHSYDTPMGEQGVRLSGGQRQRIGIARALYRNPALLVLDEASNALDAETERQVISSLLEQDLTLLIIAHRISILQGCTRILVLENGRLVAEGTFEELMETNLRFRSLASADMGKEVLISTDA